MYLNNDFGSRETRVRTCLMLSCKACAKVPSVECAIFFIHFVVFFFAFSISIYYYFCFVYFQTKRWQTTMVMTPPTSLDAAQQRRNCTRIFHTTKLSPSSAFSKRTQNTLGSGAHTQYTRHTSAHSTPPFGSLRHPLSTSASVAIWRRVVHTVFCKWIRWGDCRRMCVGILFLVLICGTRICTISSKTHTQTAHQSAGTTRPPKMKWDERKKKMWTENRMYRWNGVKCAREPCVCVQCLACVGVFVENL